MAPAELRAQLLEGNADFRRLAQEHAQYSDKLDSLINQRFLSDDEKVEEVRLKKLKLRLKDEMQRIEQQFMAEHQHHVA